MDLIWPPRDLGLRAGFDLIGYFTLSGRAFGRREIFLPPFWGSVIPHSTPRLALWAAIFRPCAGPLPAAAC